MQMVFIYVYAYISPLVLSTEMERRKKKNPGTIETPIAQPT